MPAMLDKTSTNSPHLLRRLFILPIICLYCISTYSAIPSSYTPQAYQVTFSLQRDKLSAGTMTMSLEPHNNAWLAKSIYKPSIVAKMFGLEKSIESTQFIRQNGKFLMTEYNIHLGKHNNTVYFDNQKKIYKSNSTLPENAQTNQTILSTLSNDIIKKKMQASYVIFNKEEFKQYDISYEYNKKVVINKESLNTVKAILRKGKRTTVFWLAEKWNWAPVQFAKYKNDKAIVKGKFKNIQF